MNITKICFLCKEEKELTVEDRLNIYSSKNLIKKYDWGKV